MHSESASFFALVAQGIEHRFPKAGVAGSNPAGGVCFHEVDEWVGRRTGRDISLGR